MKRHLWNGRTYLQCIRVDQCMQVCGIKPYVIFVYCKIPIAKYNSIMKWKILLRLMGMTSDIIRRHNLTVNSLIL